LSPRLSVDGFAWWKEALALSDTLGLRPMENRPAMVDIMQILEDSLTAEGIEQWLRAANRLLDGRRPVDLIDEGDTESVRHPGPGIPGWRLRLTGSLGVVCANPSDAQAEREVGWTLRHPRWRQGVVEASR
jgi:Protein of unknown function (DUF2384)